MCNLDIFLWYHRVIFCQYQWSACDNENYRCQFWRYGHYHLYRSSSYQTHYNTSDNVCLDLHNCSYSTYLNKPCYEYYLAVYLQKPSLLAYLLPVNTEVSVCCLMPSEQFSAISWREQITFNEMMMRSAQSAPKTTSPKPQSSKNWFGLGKIA